MARRAPPPAEPAPANLTPDQMRSGILRIERRLADLDAFDPEAVPERWHSSVKALETSIDETLDAVFGPNTVQRRRYREAGDLDSGPIQMSSGLTGRRYPAPDFHGYLRKGKERSIALLTQAIRWLREETESHVSEGEVPSTTKEELSDRVFIVHGRDNAPKEAVARFLTLLNLEPVILHEQANEGRTVIEKVEANANVGFAVVLLTPDDVGGLQGEDAQPRPRQNVVLELGYFLGKLGRHRVCTLALGRMELPSDWAGVIDEQYDGAGGWKMVLARELQAAGYVIDWNKVMRSA